MATLTKQDFDNGLLDMQHIGRVATSTEETSTDRLGNVTPTVRAAMEALKAPAVKTAAYQSKLGAETARDGAVAAAEVEGSFTTLALANAALAGIPADHAVYVTADEANNGFYVKRGAVLVRESRATIPSLAVESLKNLTALRKLFNQPGLLEALGISLNGTFVNGVFPIFKDLDYRTLLGIDQIGRLVAQLAPGALASQGIQTNEYGVWGSRGYSFCVLDMDGRVLFALDYAGKIVDSEYMLGLQSSSSGASVSAPPADFKKHSLQVTRTDFSHDIISGQSLALGWHGYVGTALLSTTPLYNNKMLGEVTKPDLNATTFTPLVETNVEDHGETVASGSANNFSLLLDQRRMPWDPAWRWDWVMTCNGVGGASIDAIGAGSYSYQLGLNAVTKAKAVAVAQGASYQVRCTTWIHGETDTGEKTVAQYGAAVLARHLATQTDFKAITGQTDVIPMFFDQTACHYCEGVYGKFGGPCDPTAALALGRMARTRDDWFNVVPLYIFDYSDGVHLQDHSYRRLGEFMAKAKYRVFVDRRPWKGLSFVSAAKSGAKTIDITLHVPVPPLVIDTDADRWVALAKNYGLDVLTAAGATREITRVSIVDGVKIRIECATDTVVGDRVLNAITSTGMGIGRLNGPRSNFRDSDNTLSLYPGADGKPYPLYNPLEIFNDPVTA